MLTSISLAKTFFRFHIIEIFFTATISDQYHLRLISLLKLIRYFDSEDEFDDRTSKVPSGSIIEIIFTAIISDQYHLHFA